jgi:hypothetical protein
MSAWRYLTTLAYRDQHVSDGGLRWQRRRYRDLRLSSDVVNAAVRRELEPEQVGRDPQDARPVSEGVEITDGWAVLDPADLRLSESKPGAEQFLGHTAAPVARGEFAMPTVRAGNPADVLGGERVPERWRVPEGGRHGWWFGAVIDRLALAGAAQCIRVVPGKAVAAPAVPGGIRAHLVFPAWFGTGT